jgi:zinc/manganese transport system substrate-binding protein
MMVATACTTSGSDDRLRVVVTTSIWADVVRSIVGDDADVETLIPVGADAHDYQPSPQQVADIEEAGLVVINGLGLEDGLLDILGSLEGANILSLAEGLDPIPLATTHDRPDEDADRDEGGLDPHVWFDPLRVAEAARIIAGELKAIDDSVDWMARATDFAADLEATDETIATILDAIPTEGRKLVTNHDSLGYFADRYEFEVVGVVIAGGSTLAEPSSADLAELVEAIETERVAAIFTETSHTDALAVAVAAEVGREIAVVELFTESLGEPGSGAETVAGMLETNARRITQALS